jgi:hypothetical protein
MELATVRVLADGDDWGIAARWWSVCLEAFGAATDTREVLNRVASLPDLAEIAVRLPGDSSMSYPEWILEVATMPRGLPGERCP